VTGVEADRAALERMLWRVAEPYRRVVAKLVETIASMVTCRSICLFGSLARGECLPSTDADLLIVSDTFPLSLAQRVKPLVEAFLKVEASDTYKEMRQRGFFLTFSPHPFRTKELEDTPPILLDVTVDGLVLLDDGTLGRKLRQLRRRLRRLGAHRVRRGKGWYWVLRPGLPLGERVEL